MKMEPCPITLKRCTAPDRCLNGCWQTRLKDHPGIAAAIEGFRAESGLEPLDPAIRLAKRFHEAYERLAPSFGYTTREDTREFNPYTPNGKLMVAVCEELLRDSPAHATEAWLR